MRALPSLTLVLGGARSGKSAFAERLLAGIAHPVYLATAEPLDEEMAARIAEHRARRGHRWATVEEPLALAGALERVARPGTAVLVDCLTLWLSNCLHAGRDPELERKRLLEALGRLAGPVVLVSNEVGLGLVPETALGREFRDQAGRLHQAIAERAERVYLLVAGLPMPIKHTEARDR